MRVRETIKVKVGVFKRPFIILKRKVQWLANLWNSQSGKGNRLNSLKILNYFPSFFSLPIISLHLPQSSRSVNFTVSCLTPNYLRQSFSQWKKGRDARRESEQAFWGMSIRQYEMEMMKCYSRREKRIIIEVRNEADRKS